MTIDSKSRQALWNAYCELGQVERHHGTLQSHYRVLASTWLLAGLGAVGFILSSEFNTPLPKELLVGLVGVSAAIGISLLWVIDLLVYQRLLDGAYIEGRSMESAQPWLPQMRNNIRCLLEGEGLSLISWFYILTVILMAMIGGSGLLLFASRYWNSLLIAIAGIAYAVVLVITALWMKKRTSKTPAYGLDLFDKRSKDYARYPGEP